MNSIGVLQAIDEIAAHPGKLDKERLVALYLDDPLFKKATQLAYNPMIRFGVKELPVRTENGTEAFEAEGRTVDLLINLAARNITGNAALDAIQAELNALDIVSSDLFRRILLKDMRAGFGASTLNKAQSGTVPDFPYMRCSLPPKSNMSKWDWLVGIIVQLKADGMFANVNVALDGGVSVHSRQGSEFPLYALEGFEEAAQRTLKYGTQTHGEFLVMKDGVELPREIGNGIMNSLQNGGALEEGQTLQFLAWDQIPLEEVRPKNKYKVGYGKRFASLLQQTLANPNAIVKAIPTKIVRSKEDAMEQYRAVLRQGKEGVVLKHPEAIWADSTSKDQVKFKLEVPVELEVVGFNEGTGKFEGQLGSLMCVSSCGLLQVDVSGRGDAMRAEVWANREDWLGAIVTVKANSIMNPSEDNKTHSLFLPIFVERRTDKTEADSLVRIQDQFAAAVA